MAALIAACHPAPASEHNKITEGHSPIIGGQLDYNDEGVVAFLAQDSNGDIRLCTATLVASNVLVTAAHCVAPSTIGSDNAFAVVFGFDATNGDGTEGVAEIHYDRYFDPNQPTAGHDIAIVIMDHSVNLTPYPYARSLDRSMLGAAVQIVGYGLDDGVNQTGAGVRREVVTQLDDFNDVLILVGAPGQGSCSGDSGGPVFMNVGGVKTLVGITSFGSADCTEAGDYDTRVDAFADFIDRFTGLTPPPPPPPPTTYPPPGTQTPPGTGNPGTPAPGNNDLCDSNGGVETEGNDQPSQANTVCRRGTIWGQIDRPGDTDWFKGDIPQGINFTLTLSYLAADYTMSLYRGENGQLVHIADATDNHDLSPQTITGRTDVGGTYYLKVSGVRSAWDPSHPYLITALSQ